MAKKGLSIELSGQWKEFNSMAMAFNKDLRKASLKGTKKALQYLLYEIHTRIKGGKYHKLAPLTLFLRQLEGYGDTPLVRRGGLLRALTTEAVSDFEGHVGLLKTVQGKSGPQDFTNIGLLLHEGGRIKITDKMRQSFMKKIGRLTKQSGISFLNNRGSKKGVIRIPPRRFIGDVFDDPKVVAKVEEIYRETVKEFLRA